MRCLLSLLVCAALSSIACGQTITFDPPNPTARTPVTLTVSFGTVPGCGPTNPQLVRNGRRFDVNTSFPPTPNCVSIILDGITRSFDLGILEAGVYDVSLNAPPSTFPTSSPMASAKLVVADAEPRFEVRPNVSSRPNDELHLIGNRIASCDDQPICLPPAITIGGLPATLVRVVSPNEIVVRAPNLAVGFHDVVVQMGETSYRRNAAYHFFDHTAPAHEAFFEPVLLPVLFKGPGAFGSQWDVEATVRNANEYALSTPHSSWFDVLCMPACDSRPPANTTRRSQKSNAPYGAIEFIPRQAAPLVSYGLLIRDLSRQSEALGTEVPVVREHELYSRAYSLLNVPTDSRFRTSLRVYALQPAMTTSVTVRISTMDGTLLVDEQLLVTKERLDRTEPAYVLVADILARWPQLAGKGSVTIEIAPNGGHGAPKSWAFASVTNNATQHVTVISPQ